MKLKGKTLCKLVKDELLEEDPEAYMALVVAPTHCCRRCGRASSDKDRLCKPEKPPK